MDVKKIVVVGGGGQMGNGIGQVAAASGFEVTLVDVSQAALGRGLGRIEKSLGRLVKAGKLSEDEAAAARGRIEVSTDLDTAGTQADHVIESIIEDIDAKRDVFRRLDEVLPGRGGAGH